MFTMPIGATGEANANIWSGWTGVANGSPYDVPTTATAFPPLMIGLNATQFLMVFTYTSGGSAGTLFACVGTITGTAVAYGVPEILATSTAGSISGCLVTAGSVIITFVASGTSNITAQVISISGTTVSRGNNIVVDTGSENSNSQITAYDGETRAVMYYYNGTEYALVVLSLSGFDVSAGIPYPFADPDDYTFTAISLGPDTYNMVVVSGYNHLASPLNSIVSMAAFITGTDISSIGSITEVASLNGLMNYGAPSITQTFINSYPNGAIIIIYTAIQIVFPNHNVQYAVYLNIDSSGVISPQTPVLITNPGADPDPITLQNLWIQALSGPIYDINAMVLYWQNETTIYGVILSLSGEILRASPPVLLQSINFTGAQQIAQIDSMTVIFGSTDESGNLFSQVLKSS